MVPTFSKTIKLYVFKDEGNVSVTFRITDYCSRSLSMTIDEFRSILDQWRDPQGAVYTEDSGKWWWEYRDRGPRPEGVPAHYVAISNMGWNWRITVDEMIELEESFYYQLNNKNHWD